MNIAIFADIHGRVALAFKLCARWEVETDHRFEVVDAPRLAEYSMHKWQYVSP